MNRAQRIIRKRRGLPQVPRVADGDQASRAEKAATNGGSDAEALLERSLTDLAVESWRFTRNFARLIAKLDAGAAPRYVSQMRYFQKRIEETLDAAGLRLVNVEGQQFDPGMAASAINVGDFGPDDVLVVEQMLEPIIMGAEGLRKQGTVMLRKVQG